MLWKFLEASRALVSKMRQVASPSGPDNQTKGDNVMSTITQHPASAGQIKQINRFGSDAIEKALEDFGLDNHCAQRVIERGDEFARAIREMTLASLRDLTVADKYANEEVQSKFTYPREYKGPKPIGEQIMALAKILGLDPSKALECAKNLPELPVEAEGWFAILSSDGLKKLFPQIGDDAERYCAGVRLVHKKIAASRKFYNYRDGQITSPGLRVHIRTTRALDLIAEKQPGDILIVAGQLGMRHRGRSVRRARECFDKNEFGLGSLAVGSIILTHPKRLIRWEELDMDCPGDEFNDPDTDAQFVLAPLFSFHGDEVRFGTSWFAHAHGIFGPVSAFVPQS